MTEMENVSERVRYEASVNEKLGMIDKKEAKTLFPYLCILFAGKIIC